MIFIWKQTVMSLAQRLRSHECIYEVPLEEKHFFFLVHSDKATAGQNPAYLIVHVFLTMSTDLIIRLKILVTLTGGLVNPFISQTSHRAVAS